MQAPRAQARLKADCFHTIITRRNETVREVADAATIDQNNLYRMLRGTQNPSPATRKKLLAHLGVSFDDLFEVVEQRTVTAI